MSGSGENEGDTTEFQKMGRGEHKRVRLAGFTELGEAGKNGF